MIDGIFKRLNPTTAEVLQQPSVQNEQVPDIDVDELTNALASVKGDLKVAHASLQKLYEEANYVYTRLDHMEQTFSAKTKMGKADAKPAEDEQGGGGASGIVVEKQLFVGEQVHSGEQKLAKIREAKELTHSLIQSIEQLALKVQDANTLNMMNTLRMK